jgi:uroporphyrin-III C-methyltransferase
MGKVYLVGAGPGDPELLTLKAARILAAASIVLHDALVSKEVLAKVSPAAQIIDVGKRCGRKLLTQEEINSLLVSYAATNEIVVRLKGGDPLVFGRAGEELQALREADVEYEIVPGITAALGAAAAAGISLSDRRLASQILFSTFTRQPEANVLEWGALSPATTLVLYMPGPDYAEVALRVVEAGLPADLPCVIVSGATGSQQQIRWTSVANLAQEEKLPAPALLIIGRVATHQFQELAATYWAVRETDLDVQSRPAS